MSSAAIDKIVGSDDPLDDESVGMAMDEAVGDIDAVMVSLGDELGLGLEPAE